MLKIFEQIKQNKIYMFIYTIAAIVVLMILFFLLFSNPMESKYYISFAFLWLCPIICICFMYLIPKNNEQIKTTFYASLSLYILFCVLINLLIVNSLDLFGLVMLDFFIVFVILIIGVMLNFFSKKV